jgi:hypothetical protein
MFGDKQYNLNLQEGAGQLISVAAILFQNKWVRSKTWDLIKDQMVGRTEDYALEQFFKDEETRTNINIIKDALTTGNNLLGIGGFVVKSVLKTVDAGNVKIEDIDFKFEKQLISQHPEIKVPTNLSLDGQFSFVINKLLIKSIMDNQNISENQAEQFLNGNPEIQKFITSKNNTSVMSQN